MEQHFFEDEFEQFLRENADQHRMYPSDGVWTNIYRHLHSGRRRVALIGMLLLVLSGIIWLANTDPVGTRSVQRYTAEQPVNSRNFEEHYGHGHPTVSVDDIMAKLRAKSLLPKVEIAAPKALAPLQLDHIIHPSIPSFIPLTIFSSPMDMSFLAIFRNMKDGTVPAYVGPAALATTNMTPETAGNDIADPLYENALVNRVSLQNGEVITVPETISPIEKGTSARLLTNAPLPQSMQAIRLSVRDKNRFSFLMHFAPSIGYRNLYEGKSNYTTGNSPLMVRHLNVNQFVDHQPAVGFELGGGIRYQASRILSFRTGVQLNLTRYTIEAFSAYPEKATLALNSDFGVRDTLVATSNIRNLAGDDPNRLQNQYLQVAIPIGAELKLFGDSKLQVNLAGSIQPSYLLNSDQYMLSSNLSNYVKEPSLIRRWNMATSMEAFVSYQSGDLRWQIGPQFRYNLFSTYKSQYPIRENLVEYGLKIGISKSLR